MSYSNYNYTKNFVRSLDKIAKDLLKDKCNKDLYSFVPTGSYYDTHYHCDVILKYEDGYLIGDLKTITDKYANQSLQGISTNYSFRIINAEGQYFNKVSNHSDVIIFACRGRVNGLYGFMLDTLAELVSHCVVHNGNKGKEKYVLIPEKEIYKKADFYINNTGIHPNVYPIDYSLDSTAKCEEIHHKLRQLSLDTSNRMKEYDIDKIFETYNKS